jgi:arabinogalactan endo-1,4-beta-galactosidase
MLSKKRKNSSLLLLLFISTSLLVGCNKTLSYDHEFKTYEVGTTTNSEYQDYNNIIVNGPTNKVNDDFAYGVDCSVVHDIESNGGRYYNEDGKEEDIFKILANDGANYARFRLWVDPWSSDGKAYGGGTNDTYTDVYLAKRAQAAGMKILIDFHYSDSWADPSKQWRPKAWAKLSYSQLPDKIKEYTSSALNDFKSQGVTVNAVQIGNETNSKICGVPYAQSSLTTDIYKAGIEGVKSVFGDAKTIIHLTNVKSKDGIIKYCDMLKKYEVNYDVMGFSYYPYWHGSKTNLLDVMSSVATTYNKEVMICETAWGFTDDTTPYAKNQFSTSTFGQAGGYTTSSQGQASELADLVDVLSQVPNKAGIGLFYWEPDWLPVNGSNWISASGAYYNDHGIDGTDSKYDASYCLGSWANQAWFSYTGKVLPSAATYKHIKALDKTATVVISGLVNSEVDVTLNLADSSDTLPTTLQGYSNIGAYRDVPVTWNQTQIDAMKEAGDGDYDIDGTAGGFTCVAHVSAISNYIADPSFEKQGNDAETPVVSPWELTCSGDTSTAHIESKSEGNRTGSNYFHWYSTVSFSWTISQKITGVRKSTFKLNTYIMTNAKDTEGKYTKMDLWVKVNDGDKTVVDCLDKCAGWKADLKTGMLECKIEDIVVSEANSTVEVGMDCAAGAKCWGHNDDWALAEVKASA